MQRALPEAFRTAAPATGGRGFHASRCCLGHLCAPARWVAVLRGPRSTSCVDVCGVTVPQLRAGGSKSLQQGEHLGRRGVADSPPGALLLEHPSIPHATPHPRTMADGGGNVMPAGYPTMRELAWVGLASFAIVGQLAAAISAVGKARHKYKIKVPATTGVSADFDRYFRAASNSQEFAVVAVPLLWTWGFFGAHWMPGGTLLPALVGLWYAGARFVYARGYQRSLDGRLLGFKWSTRALYCLFFGALASVVKLIVAGV